MAVQVPPHVNVSDVGQVVLNYTEVWKNMPPDMVSGIGALVTILKAVGIIFLIYLIFLIVRSILNIIEKRRIKEIQKKIFEMDKKLDKIIDSKKK